ncbi:MAG: ABC transporter substrate-binding protein [Pseudomonadota bacterium]|jgi:branched-chain amino acid transport system substrate-binding protein
MLSGRHPLLALAAATLLCSAAAAQNAPDIKIGFNGDLSASPSASSGQAAVLAMQLAADDLNAKGGLLGRKLVIVARDDLALPPKSIQNMSDLIDSEKVAAILGPTNSGNAMAWKQIPNQKRIPVIVPLASGSDITKPLSEGADNYMFRVSMSDRAQVGGLLAYAKADPAAKAIAFAVETTGYGQGGLKDMTEVAALQNLKPVMIEKFGVADTDMTSQLTKLKAAGVDTLVVWAQGAPLGHLLRSMDKIGYFPKVLSSWAADNPSFIDTAGAKLADRPIFLRTVGPERTPRQQQLFDRLGPKLNPGAFHLAAHTYDAMMLLALAITQAGSTDGPALRAALEHLNSPHDGFIKAYDKPFSPTQHEALAGPDYKWAHWQDGKLATYSDAVTAALKPADFKQ